MAIIVRSTEAQCCRIVDELSDAIKIVERSNGRLFIDFDSDVFTCEGVCSRCSFKACTMVEKIILKS